MAILEILKDEHPLLRKPSKTVRRVEQEVRKLISDMKETMTEFHGAGLAAVQVGVLKRIIVLAGVEGPFAVVNPKIASKEGKISAVEGCLSFPGLVADVRRWEKVKVKGLNDEGKPFMFHAEGLLCRAVQHELDHLDGILFFDRAEPGTLRKVEKTTFDEVIQEQIENMQL